MDEVDYGIRQVLRNGGGKSISIPSTLFKELKSPKSFRWETGKDGIARLIPIYSFAFVPVLCGSILSWYLFSISI